MFLRPDGQARLANPRGVWYRETTSQLIGVHVTTRLTVLMLALLLPLFACKKREAAPPDRKSVV